MTNSEYVGAEKPDLLSLEHYGKKGMKWGVRKAKPSTSDIKDARARQASRIHEVNNRTHELNLATAPGSGKSKKAQDTAVKKYQQAIKNLDNSDTAVAARMTRGEKAALLILTGPIGAAAIIGNKVQVKKIEKQQAAGK